MGRKSLAVIVALLLCCLPGCGPREPKTYPVTGKVVFLKGGKVAQLQGWSVQFQSVAEPDMRATGDLGPDGAFKIVSIVNNRGKAGVVEGQHRICVRNLLDPNAKAIDPKFMNFETSGITVTVPLEKEFVIEVWR